MYYSLLGLLCFIQLEMHVRLICAIKFYLLTYVLIFVRPTQFGHHKKYFKSVFSVVFYSIRLSLPGSVAE